MVTPEGFLLDVDGVIVESWQPLPGALEAISDLRSRGIPFRFITNTTAKTRRELAGTLASAGFEIRPAEILTAPSATAAYLRANHPGKKCFLIAKGDVDEDLDGVELVGDGGEVVVIGGAEENFTYDNLNRAFRMLMDGAALVSMHRNMYWKTQEGLTLDAGAFLAGLEQAAGVEAVVVGKPSPEFFRAGLSELGMHPEQVAMVGDDVRNDVLAAQDAGIQGVLVRTGKFRPTDLEGEVRPDRVIDSIASIGDLLA
ncbi:MAG: TIGR01458 family HAD-type hydrolase [Actinobacteria bacterium]|nr:TIGR01458 family HAD-type hydrolase [Actinomycetota bacterium]